MTKFSVVFLCLAMVAVNIWSIKCITEEEKSAMEKVLKPIAMKCASNCGFTKEDHHKYKKDDDMDLCFKKSFLPDVGILDEAGKYNSEALHESVSQYIKHEKEAKQVQDQIDSCFDANGDNYGDDEESQMKRIDVLFKCLKDIKE